MAIELVEYQGHVIYILTNPSNTKSGTISLKNRDFCPKSGTFLKNLAKMAKNGNIRGKMLHTRNHKNRDMPYFIRRKRGTSRILAPKIGTVPPKSGRLESMCKYTSVGVSTQSKLKFITNLGLSYSLPAQALPA